MTNKEGYRDPTAEMGIKRAMTLTYKMNLVKQIILLVCKLAGVRLSSEFYINQKLQSIKTLSVFFIVVPNTHLQMPVCIPVII